MRTELDAKPALSVEVASNDPCEVMTAMLLRKAKKPIGKSLCAGDRSCSCDDYHLLELHIAGEKVHRHH